MHLQRLVVWNWRSIDTLDLTFQPGLNLIFGPNESGKSSLREAITEAFTQKCNVRGKSTLSKARPWSGNTPAVKVEFEAQGFHWVLVRKFFGKGESELVRDGKVIAKGDATLGELIRSARTQGLSALWSVQGQVTPASVAPEVKAQLTAREVVAPGAAWLQRALESQYDTFFTEKQGQPRKELKEVRDAYIKAQTLYDQLQRELARHKESLLEAETQEQEIEKLQSQMQLLSQQLQQVRAEQAQEKEAFDSVSAQRRTEHERVQDWLSRWKRHTEKFLETWKDWLIYSEERDSLEQRIAQLPTDAPWQQFKHKYDYSRARLGSLLSHSLSARPAVTEEHLQQLASLEKVRYILQSARKLAVPAEMSERCQSLSTQLLQWQLQCKEAENQAELQEKMVQERQAAVALKRQTLESQLRSVQARQEDWKNAKSRLTVLWPQQQQAEARIQEIDQALTQPEPNRSRETQARLQVLEHILHLCRQQEKSQLHSPSLEHLRQLKECEEGLASLLQHESLENQRQAVMKELEQLNGQIGPLESLCGLHQTELDQLQRQVNSTEEQRQRSLLQKQEQMRQRQDQLRTWQTRHQDLVSLQNRKATYEHRRSELLKVVGSPPDPLRVNEARAKLRQVRQLLRKRLQEALIPFASLSEESVASLAAAFNEAPDSTQNWTPTKSLILATGLFGLTVALCLGLGQPAPKSLAMALVFALAVAGLAHLLLKPSSDSVGKTSPKAKLLTELQVTTLEEAKQKLEQARILRKKLERIDVNESENGAELESQESLDLSALESLAVQLQSQAEQQEKEYQSALDSEVQHKQALEALRLEDPTSDYQTALQLARACATQVFGEEPQDEPLQWKETVSEKLTNSIKELEDSIGDLQAPQASPELTARSEDLATQQRLLKQLQEKAQIANGQLQALKKQATPQPDQSRERLESVKRDLLSKYQADSLQQLENRFSRASELQNLPQGRPCEKLEQHLAQWPGLKALQSLEADACTECILGISKEIEEAEKLDQADRLQRSGLLAEKEQLLANSFLSELSHLSETLDQLDKPQATPSAWYHRLTDTDTYLETLEQEIHRLQSDLDKLEEVEGLPNLLETHQTLVAKAKEHATQQSTLEKQLTAAKAEMDAAQKHFGDLRDQHSSVIDISSDLDGKLAQTEQEYSQMLDLLQVQNLGEAQQLLSQQSALRERQEHFPVVELPSPSLEDVDQLSMEELYQLCIQLNQESADLETQSESNAALRAELDAQTKTLLDRNPSGRLQDQWIALTELLGEAGHCDIPDKPHALDPDTWSQPQRTRLAELSVQLPAPAQMDQLAAQASLITTNIKELHEKILTKRDARSKIQGQLNGSRGLYSKLAEAAEDLDLKDKARKAMELDAEASRTLLEAFEDAQLQLKEDLIGPLRDRVDHELRHLTDGRYLGLDIDTDSNIQGVTLVSRNSAKLDDLSLGTQEQVSFLSRLCLAEMLSESQGERHFVVFDDSLVHSDGGRLQTACNLMAKASQNIQILVFSCHPSAFASLLPTANIIELKRLRHASPAKLAISTPAT